MTGCRITVSESAANEEDDYIENESETKPDAAAEIIHIDFTDGNDNLSKLEPMLERPGMTPVDFIYEGFLIRLRCDLQCTYGALEMCFIFSFCRPNLDEFLEYCNDDYDVVIYTVSYGLSLIHCPD